MSKLQKILWDFLGKINQHNVMTLAAALAFYTALSLAPLLLICLAIFGWLGNHSVAQFVDQIQRVIGSQAGEAIQLVANNAKNRQDLSTVSGVIGTIVLIFSASGIFSQLQSSLNIIWETKTQNAEGNWAWVKRRLASMGIVLALGFLSMVSLAVNTMLSFIFTKSGPVWSIVNEIGTLFTFCILFAAMYRVLPDTRISWSHAFRGALVTAVLFALGKQLIGVYLGKSAVGSAYGATGSLIVFLVWVYYSAVILFIGAEITALLKRGSSPTTSSA